MKIVDEYLRQHGKKRYDVYKQTGVSQQTLANANVKSSSGLTVRILKALATTVGTTAGDVLNEILMIEEGKLVMEVTTKEDLIDALNNSGGKIIVSGELCYEVISLAKKMYTAQFPGLNVGTAVGICFFMPLLEKALNSILSVFRNDTEEQKINFKLSDKLRHYNVHYEGPDKIMLISEQLEY